MSTTNLKITVQVGGQIAVNVVPTREQLSAKSRVTLDNGSFSRSVGALTLTVDPGVPFKTEFGTDADGKTRSVEITVMGGLSGKKIVLPRTTITLDGLTVELDEEQAIALIGTMAHRVNTGSFTVSSTNNPQGDTLPSNVESRKLALVP